MMKAINLLLLLDFLLAISLLAQPGTLTGIQASQRTDGSGLVDIYYGLFGDYDAYNISVEVSFDGGSTFSTVPQEYLQGAVTGVTPSGSKHIIWNGLESFPNTFSTQAQIMMMATGYNIDDSFHYWIEETERLWVRVPIINPGINTFRVSKGGNKTPDGSATFEFFDDFAGTSLDTYKWGRFPRPKGGGTVIVHDKLHISVSSTDNGELIAGQIPIPVNNETVFKLKPLNYGSSSLWGKFLMAGVQKIQSSTYSTVAPIAYWIGERTHTSHNPFVSKPMQERMAFPDATPRYGRGEKSLGSLPSTNQKYRINIKTLRESDDRANFSLKRDNSELYSDWTEAEGIGISPSYPFIRHHVDTGGPVTGEYYWFFVKKLIENEGSVLSIDVIENPAFYEVVLENSGSQTLIGYQISINESELGGLLNDESLIISYE